MLNIKGIDQEKCIKCERCIDVCLMGLYSKIKTEELEKKIEYSDPNHFCFHCGHCLSICPTNAILFESDDKPFEFPEIKKPEIIASYKEIFKLIRSRRTTRLFKKGKVERDKIELVLNAMRYAPTASNRQRQQFIVITNKEEIQKLSVKVMNMYLRLRTLFKFKTIIRLFAPKGLRKQLKSKKIEAILNMYNERFIAGEDLIFYNAPVVIILHAPAYSQMSASDGGVALTHGMFAAQSLGLGSAWIGFAHEYLWRSKKARRELGIPDKNNCYGVLAIGYPKFHFQRAPPRNKLKVKWIN